MKPQPRPSQIDAHGEPSCVRAGLATALMLRLATVEKRIAAASITVLRTADPERLVRGRTPAEAADIVGTLFASCGRAHRAALLAAAEAALGLSRHGETLA